MTKPKVQAEELAAAAMACDMAEWVVYDPSYPEQPIEDWLNNYPPSQISR